jgi:hypothetical protein
MSLKIEVDSVDAVLLADGWHEVDARSFDLDSYEFHHQDSTLLGGGSEKNISATGATWREPGGTRIACPIDSVIAVKIVTR